MLQGFDVSHHLGGTDWATLKSRYGIEFGAAKATEGTAFKDDRFPTNWSRMRSAGLVRMAYHFGRPSKDPILSVRTFVQYVGTYGLLATDLFVLDLETGDGLSQDAVNAWAKKWAAEFRNILPGYNPGIYEGRAYLVNRTGNGLRGPFGWLWYPAWPSRLDKQAAWPSTFNPPLPTGAESWADTNWGGPPNFWQFSDDFPALGEPTDANVYNGTLTTLRTLNSTTGGGGGGAVLPGKEEDDMAMTPAEYLDLLNKTIINTGRGPKAVSTLLSEAATFSELARNTALDIRAAVALQADDEAQLTAAINNAAVGLLAQIMPVIREELADAQVTVDPAQFEAATERAVRRVLGGLDETS